MKVESHEVENREKAELINKRNVTLSKKINKRQSLVNITQTTQKLKIRKDKDEGNMTDMKEFFFKIICN